MKKLVIGTMSLTFAALAPTIAQAQDVSVSTSIDLVSEYVFRGISFAETAIQPGVEVSVNDFTVGAWYSAAIGESSAAAGDEIDLYASYSVPLFDNISTDIGITYYHFPQGGSLFETDGGGAGTYEVFGSLGFDTLLSPSVAAYYDFTLEAFTLEGGVSHSFDIAEKATLDFGITGGLVDGDGFSYEYGLGSASIGYSFTDDASAYVGVNYSVNSEDFLKFRQVLTEVGENNLVWAGIGIATGF